ncbi:hypothetical protein CH92_05660 [Stutzerimonas stutzeri]|uniref:Uncharacterized protein n=1 Tax=Stutzerimonas stutzeri TaxID=316 RepID=W8QWE7_STUST|nr:DUF6152 family protein [Stutzerimonas stutzeri]AHL74609.1 hypothetical protein CH92_05660 [Stutzerimonas stutzeri]MCQ4329138.1 DUF6152 family protein [Stutzerimonas stutzeri]
MLVSTEIHSTRAVTALPFVHRMALLLCVAAMVLFTTQTFAHHGWSWAEEEQSELKGTISEISMAPPHPALRVKAQDGRVWQVDLSNPSQTQRSGFTGDTAEVGDDITVLGNRTKEPNKAHMKAVRITVDGKQYDMYPERIKE